MAEITQLRKLSLKVLTKLDALNMTIGCAESCTGGMISQYLTLHPGSSKVFKASLITYSNGSKTKLLNVEPNIIEKFGAVSEEVTEQMVRNLLKITKVDIGIAVSGIAGPAGGTVNKPIGLVHHHISIKNKLYHI